MLSWLRVFLRIKSSAYITHEWSLESMSVVTHIDPIREGPGYVKKDADFLITTTSFSFRVLRVNIIQHIIIKFLKLSLIYYVVFWLVFPRSGLKVSWPHYLQSVCQG